jgi:outer membrane protein OmpA-like peptidoglycan-associated protein/tetratricopeptide (TPR) repeat protein
MFYTFVKNKKPNMKLFRASNLFFLGSGMMFLASCDLVKDVTYSVSPNPLEMHADSVKIAITVNVPAKGIKKKAKAEITPKLGSYAIGTWYVNGEKVTENGTTINFKNGGTATFEQTVPYLPEMEAADLVVTGKIYKQTKEKDALPEMKIADATIITPYLVNKTFKVLYEEDALVRQFEKTTDATFNFEKGKSDVRATELKDTDIAALVSWIQAAQSNPKIKINKIEINGYASPDGEVSKNDNLSFDRTATTRTAIIALMKKANLTAFTDTNMYKLTKYGEDFEGFKTQLALSTTITEADKNLFIRILEMTKDLEQREKEMYNLGKSYSELEKDVFPKIRRAMVVVKYTEFGLTDDELKAAASNNPNSLSVEELLFTANKLTTDLNDKARIYGVAATNFANDYRTHTNLGAARFQLNKTAEAKSSFEKAAAIKDNGISKNNLAASLILDGNTTNAKKLIAQAKTAFDSKGDATQKTAVNYNQGILNIMEAKYTAADGNFSDNSFNKALAQVLSGKLDAAKKTVSGLTETAETAYLKAIIAARSNEGVDAVVAQLKIAISKNASLKDKAAKDREFLKISTESTFTNIVK